ncbi:MAG: hypothetical protein WD648_15530 [Planctomycetaceae bacterium]
MPAFPPTIIVVHPRERRAKCTVNSLRGRDDFVFWKYPTRGSEPLEGYVRLGFGGPVLSDDDASAGLLVLDGTWRLAGSMEKSFADVPVRSLPELRTAYPRASKTSVDPVGGLATIEAVYAAYKLLGRDTGSLLDDYRWGDEFLALNQGRL